MKWFFVLIVVAVSAIAASAKVTPSAVTTGPTKDGSVCNSKIACVMWFNQGEGGAFRGGSARGSGLIGVTHNPSFSNFLPRYGVLGMDSSTDGGAENAGVAGVSMSGLGASATSQFGDALHALAANGTALQGQSLSRVGIFGTAGDFPGVWGLSLPGSGVLAEGGGTDSQNFVHPALGIVTQTSTGDEIDGCSISNAPCTTTNSVFRVDQSGNIFITGQIFTGGSCSNGCALRSGTPGRRVVSYAPRESLPTQEDFGEAQLIDGRAHIALDPSFAGVIDRSQPYLVFITPDGDTRGLYVAQKTSSGFDVREAQGGRSSIAFDYRIVAKPFGGAAKRLPVITVYGKVANGARFAVPPRLTPVKGM